MIEHPKWIPLAAQKKLDMRAGDDKGRIYRIYPEGKQPRAIAQLDQLDTAGLVAALDSPNGTQRDLAHQMLLWRNDKGAIELLKKLVATCIRPQSRLQALCALDGLGGTNDEILQRAMADEYAGVRRHAVRLAEPRFNESAPLAAAMERLAGDSDVQVRIQVAYSLGEWKDGRQAAALAKLLLANAMDPYLTAAALSSVNPGNVGEVLAEAFAADGDCSAAVRDRLLSMAAAMGQDAAVGKAVATILQKNGNETERWAALAGVADGLARRSIKLATLLDDSGKQRLHEQLLAARQRVKNSADGGKESAMALAAVPLLARGLDDQDKADVDLLSNLLAPQQPPDVQAAAVTAVVRAGGAETPN
ncbi:MAG: hypothetical protein JF612_12585, partial [Planctomycetia bacterium]|nr:hypothetical protein [Planctomycetia bacterium]